MNRSEITRAVYAVILIMLLAAGMALVSTALDQQCPREPLTIGSVLQVRGGC
jgi:hypothetical protein